MFFAYSSVFNLVTILLPFVLFCAGILFLFLYYRKKKDKLKQNYHEDFYSLDQKEVITKFLQFSKINHFKLQQTENYLHPFRHLDRNILRITPLPMKTKKGLLDPLALDFLLFRTFLATLKTKDPRLFWSSYLIIYLFPVLLFWIFWLFFIFNITFYFLTITNINLINNNNFFFALSQSHVLIFLLYAIFILYLFLVVLNFYYKNKLASTYNQVIRVFMKKEYPQLFYDFLQARYFDHEIKFVFTFGFNWLFRIDSHYVGPLSLNNDKI